MIGPDFCLFQRRGDPFVGSVMQRELVPILATAAPFGLPLCIYCLICCEHSHQTKRPLHARSLCRPGEHLINIIQYGGRRYPVECQEFDPLLEVPNGKDLVVLGANMTPGHVVVYGSVRVELRLVLRCHDISSASHDRQARGLQEVRPLLSPAGDAMVVNAWSIISPRQP